MQNEIVVHEVTRGIPGRAFEVPGLTGYYSCSNRNSFTQLHYCIPSDNGIGLKSRSFVGSVPLGNYGSDGPSGPITPSRNAHWRDQVEERVKSDAAERLGADKGAQQ